jgi:iron uptake system component EfeO
VHQQALVLLGRVAPFVQAVRAGDVAKAKRLFARARAPYETIEPVAESFGDLDPRIDARVDDVEPGDPWTGFHRIERQLWEHGNTTGMGKVAGGLLADCRTLERRTRTLRYQPEELANGANGLLDEVASSKVTGEEDRYSHTDLSDFEANVSGAQTTFGLLAPALDRKLARTVSARFGAVQAELASLKRGSGYPSYASVGDAERKRLSGLVEQLAKPLAGTARALG